MRITLLSVVVLILLGSSVITLCNCECVEQPRTPGPFASYHSCVPECQGGCTYDSHYEKWYCRMEPCGPNTCKFGACGNPDAPCDGTCVQGTAAPNDFLIFAQETLRKLSAPSSVGAVVPGDNYIMFKENGERLFHVRQLDNKLTSSDMMGNSIIYPWYTYKEKYYLGPNPNSVYYPQWDRINGGVTVSVYNASESNQRITTFRSLPTGESRIYPALPILHSFPGGNTVVSSNVNVNKTIAILNYNVQTRQMSTHRFSNRACQQSVETDFHRSPRALLPNWRHTGPSSGIFVWTQKEFVSKGFEFFCAYDIDKNEVFQVQVDVTGDLRAPKTRFHPNGMGPGRPSVTFRSRGQDEFPANQLLVLDFTTGEQHWIDSKLETLKYGLTPGCDTHRMSQLDTIYMNDGNLFYTGFSSYKSLYSFNVITERISVLALPFRLINPICKSTSQSRYAPSFIEGVGYAQNRGLAVLRTTIDGTGRGKTYLSFVQIDNLMNGCDNTCNLHSGFCTFTFTCASGKCTCAPGCSGVDCTQGDFSCASSNFRLNQIE